MSKRILLVEDEALIAMNEAQILKKHGYEVLSVSNGEKAIEEVDSDPEISLILMDIDLGKGMDGTEAAEKILESHELPIVFLTSHSEKEYVNRVKKITNYGYVLKNSGEFVLIEAIYMAFSLFEFQRSLKKEIEERKKAENKQSDYQDILDSTLNAVDSLIMVIDKNYKIVLSNWKDHEWVPEEEREKRPYCYKAMKNFTQPCEYCPSMQAFEDGNYRLFEDVNPIDNSRKEVSVVPLFNDYGKVEYVLENVRDVTKQKTAEEKYKALYENAPLPYQSLDKNGNFIDVNPGWLEAFGGYTREDVTEERQLKKELQESEKRYRNIVENINDSLIIHDFDGIITFVNDTTCTLFSYSRDELIGRSIADIHASEHRGFIQKSIQDSNWQERLILEIEMIDKYDNTVPVEVNTKIVSRDGSGEIQAVVRDITERKEREEELKKSEKKYRLITENASDIIVQVDEQLKPIYVSPSVTTTLGYTLEELSEANVLEFVPLEDQKRLAELINEKTNKKEKKLTHLHRIHTKSGEIRWMETRASLSYDANGQFNGAIYVDRDITDIRKLERVNKERRQLLEAILEATPNAVLTIDSRSRITEWNRGAEILFHYTKYEVLGQDIDKIVSQDDDVVFEEAFSFTQRAINGRGIAPTETVRFTKEGEPLHVIVAGSPIIVDGEFNGVVATYTDISQLKQKEKDVVMLLEEKEHLLHEVHHRIKNHMSIISSIISLRTSHVDNPHIRDILDEIQNKVNLMQNIYQSLYIGEDVGIIRISSYIGQVLNHIQSAYLEGRQISLSTDIEEIEVTSKQSLPIGIIVTELITNSIKYAFPENGRGKISLSIKRDIKNDSLLCIEVFDNGKGIALEIVENEEYGFGITLVEGYTKQFDGTMSISTVGGTKVNVVLELE